MSGHRSADGPLWTCLSGCLVLEDGLPKLARKTRVSIRDYCHRQAMLAKHTINKQLRCTLTIDRLRHSRYAIHLAQPVNKDHNTCVAMRIFRQAEHKVHTNGLPTHDGNRQTLRRRRRMRRGFNSLESFTSAHICAHPLIQFGPPIGLTYHAIGLFTTKMTTHSGAMRLIEDAILEVLIKRNHNSRRINRVQ